MPEPQRIEIDCATKSGKPSPHDAIAFVGGRNARGTRWKLSQDQAIHGMKGLRWAFYVTVAGQAVTLIIARGPRGHEYLKAESEGTDPAILLALPDCP